MFRDTRDSLRRLDQHQQKRKNGIPTLSVLVGPPSQVMSLWLDWSLGSGRELLLISQESRDLVRRAAGEWLSRPWIMDRLIDHLSPGINMPSQHVRELLKGESCQERMNIAAQMISLSSPRSVEMVSRCLLEGEAGSDYRALMEGLALIEGHLAPGLLFLSYEAPEETVKVLADLIELCPGVPVAWSIPSSDYLEFLERTPSSRAGMICREGLVVLGEHPVEDTGWKPLRHEECFGGLLSKDAFQCPSESVDLHEAADPYPGDMATGQILRKSPEQLDRARSAAEAFLYDRLESLPETAGMFQLNGVMSADWGPHGRVEVDLLCMSRRVAVEIDGYHHFCDPEGYRKDRQKDIILQQQGFLVLRFLADDVVSRMEVILNTVLSALRWRDDHDRH